MRIIIALLAVAFASSVSRAGRAAVPARAVLAEAAAGELDPRPGLRASPSTATTTSGSCTGPRTLLDDEKGAMANPPATKCCKAAPAVMEFDADGNLLRSWGGPGQGYDWPKNEHGIFVDDEGNVWVAGNDKERSPDPEIHARRQVPAADRQATTASRARTRTTQLGRPAHMVIDDAANELYVADGYRQPPHHRVRREDRRLQAPLGRLRQGADRRQAAGLRPGRAAVAELRQPGALRAAVERRPGLCLRPRQRPHPGVPQGRHLREGVPRRAADAARTARSGTWCCRATRSRNSSSWPTAPTARSACWRARTARCSRSGAATAASPASSSGCTTSAIDSKGNLYTAEVGFGRRVQKFLPVAPVVR